MMAKSENSEQKYIEEIEPKSVEKVKANPVEKMENIKMDNEKPPNIPKGKVEDKNNAMGSGCSQKKKSTSKRHAIREKSAMEWRVGDYCRAAYEEDSLLYEAKIVGVVDDCFIVEFLGYGNKQRVYFNCLAASFGKRAREKQRRIAADYWSVGNFCRAVYPEDGLLYEAVIEEKVDDSHCLVQYIGYEGTEVVSLQDLAESEGPKAREMQRRNTSGMWMHYRDPQHAENDDDVSSSSSNYSLLRDTSSSQSRMSSTKVKMPTCSSPCSDHYEQASHSSARCHHATSNNNPFPSAPFPFQNVNLPESCTLSSLLMAWYLAGYHTGYFEGVRSKNSER